MYALISDGVVIDLAPAAYATSLPAASWVDASATPAVAIGWVQVGTQLQPPAVAEVPRSLSKLTIIDRATDEEIETLAAMRTSPDASARRFAARWDAAVTISPTDPATVAAFESVFGAARAAELLA